MERRTSPRSPVTVNVYIPIKGKNHQVCRTIDLSSRGVYLAAESSIFPIDAPIVLFFAVRKHNGSVIQLHRMTAKVVRFGIRGVALTFCRQAKTPANRQLSPATVSLMKR
ncbi:MAG: PilZ domain-containing protein [Methylococcaceae bacterium]|nr:PilZ domain-containing protein [Methylococcaceae bacterium]MCI0733998.1 PilZ domain-containing protein [Methylococcaceae bacterium]